MKKYAIIIAAFLLGSCTTTKDATTTLPEAPAAAIEAEITKGPKNIILMIGDGMGITQITAGVYSSKTPLALEQFKNIGLHKCYASNDLITDSAAAATSFACGIKTYNGAIGVDDNEKPVKTILEIAEEKGLATGLVATSTIVHATPASFISHQKQRSMYEEIAGDFMNTEIDLFIGGGKKYFDRRVDKRNLIKELQAKDYQVASFLENDLAQTEISGKNFAYFTADSDPLPVAGGRDYLTDAGKISVDFLKDRSEKGFFLMIEGSQIDWGGHANDGDYIITEMLDFDKAIAEVLKFAKEDGETLVIVTADHETGGFAINKGSTRDSLVMKFTSDYHTADLIPVFAYGPGSEDFRGIYENTAIFDKMLKAYGW